MPEAGTQLLSGSTLMEESDFRDALQAHSAGTSLGFMLWHTTLSWQRKVDAALSEFRLTHAQFALLATTWWLGRDGDAPNQRQVAEHAGVGEVMASQILRLLERNGMIVRQPSRTDVRAMALTLTEEGSRLAQRAVVEMDRVDAEFFGAVDDSDSLLKSLRLLGNRTPSGEASERRS
jgi:DNA-binding MarR family transcriptional regulator